MNAYPGINLDSENKQQNFLKRLNSTFDDADRCLYGLYEDDELLGTMMLYDFKMTLQNHQAKVGGVGQIAVDLLHKKAKVAKEMMSFFMHHYQDKGVSLLMLYPFRPDFYKRMGFGYGSKLNHYQYRPAALPRGDTKSNLRFLRQVDAQAMLACYNRYAERTHGMVIRSEREVLAHLANPSRTVVAHQVQDRITGYIVFDFEKGHSFIHNNLRIVELVYEEPAALKQIMTFLHTQQDQVDWIVHNTHDNVFHHLLFDPRNETRQLIPSVYHESNTQGVGLMYRVIYIPGIFKVLAGHDFGGLSCRLKLVVDDSFLSDTPLATNIHFMNGHAEVTSNSDSDVTVNIDISDFSSLIMGVVDFGTLFRYGLVQISDMDYLENLDTAFKVARQPQCMTHF